ncbi:hypothetical protein CIW50_27780 [Tardiphaga sp. P9-11]|nr:hypothetical protein CIW50_27780 [Tardiphaga sp. P9-11]
MAKSVKPSHEAFVVSGEGEGAQWTKVGAAWQHEDQKGFNVSLVPGLSVSGKIVLRVASSSRKSATT